MSPFDRPSASPAHPSATWPRRNRPATSSVQVWHFPGQKLRLGGDALGADPTYLLYLPSRSRGELRRTDFGPGCAGATWSDFAAPESTRKPPLQHDEQRVGHEQLPRSGPGSARSGGKSSTGLSGRPGTTSIYLATADEPRAQNQLAVRRAISSTGTVANKSSPGSSRNCRAAGLASMLGHESLPNEAAFSDPPRRRRFALTHKPPRTTPGGRKNTPPQRPAHQMVLSGCLVRRDGLGSVRGRTFSSHHRPPRSPRWLPRGCHQRTSAQPPKPPNFSQNPKDILTTSGREGEPHPLVAGVPRHVHNLVHRVLGHHGREQDAPDVPGAKRHKMRPAAIGAGTRRWGAGEVGSRGGRLTPTSSSSCSHRPRSSDAPPTLRGSEGPSAAARPSCRSPTRSACDQSCREPGGAGGWVEAMVRPRGVRKPAARHTTVRSGRGRRTGSGRQFKGFSPVQRAR